MRALISLSIAALCLFSSGCFLFPRLSPIHAPKSPPVEAPKTVTEIRTVIVHDLALMFRICMGIGLAGVAASLALMVFVPYLSRYAGAGLVGFGGLFGMSFLTTLLLPYAMWIAIVTLALVALAIAVLIYHLAKNDGIIKNIALHPEIEKIQDGLSANAARAVQAIRRKVKK